MKQRIQVIGTVGKDATVKTLTSGGQVLSFSVATNKSYRDKSGEKKQITTWFNVSKFYKDNEPIRVADYIKKGGLITVEGEVSARAYMVAGNPEPQASLEIRADEIVLLGIKKDGEEKTHTENNSLEPIQQVQGDASDDLPF
jgi:single-strand DNA-binding protein